LTEDNKHDCDDIWIICVLQAILGILYFHNAMVINMAFNTVQNVCIFCLISC